MFIDIPVKKSNNEGIYLNFEPSLYLMPFTVHMFEVSLRQFIGV